jgi:hypothetical protein
LTAELAVQGTPERGRHFAVDSPVDQAELAFSLNKVADACTQPALYADIHIESNEMAMGIHVMIPCLPGEEKFRNRVLMNQFLKPAVTGRVAGRTIERMGPEQQHKLLAAACDDLGGMCDHFHPVVHERGARGHGEFATSEIHLHYANAATTVRWEPFVVTEGWDTDPVLLSGLE